MGLSVLLFVMCLLHFCSTPVDSFKYEMLRRLQTTTNGTVVWAGEESGITIVTNCTADEECGTTALCFNSSCQCNAGYYTLSVAQSSNERIQNEEKNICGYIQTSKSLAIIVSVIFGGCGVDRCLLARGDANYICIGITKGVTIGACTLLISFAHVLFPILIIDFFFTFFFFLLSSFAVFKYFTGGVWYVLDIILIVFGLLWDANGVPLYNDT